MRNKKVYCGAVLFLVFLFIDGVLGMDIEVTRDTLKGLPGMRVITPADGEIAPNFTTAGLDGKTIKTDVELRLRALGIQVLSQEEAEKTPGSPALVVTIVVIPGNAAMGWTAYISVGLYQEVFLARQLGIRSRCETWSDALLTYGGDKGAEYLREKIIKMVDRFANAYLSVNPKGGTQ